MKRQQRKTSPGRFLALAALAGATVIALTWLAPPAVDPLETAPRLSVWEFEGRQPRLEQLKELGLSLSIELLRMLPIGLLLPFALPGTEGFTRRLFRVFVPSLALATAVVYVIRGSELGAGWIVPSMIEVALPLLGIWTGVVAGMVLLKGRKAVAVALATGAVVMGIVAFWLFGLAGRIVDDQPLNIAETTVTSEAKRQFIGHIKESNPRNVPPGGRGKLTLSPEELNFLLAWGGSLIDDAPRSRVETSVGAVDVSASLPIPRLDGRYLNLHASSELALVKNNIHFDLRRLSVGSVQTPQWILEPASRMIRATLRQHRVLGPTVESIESLDIQNDGLSIVYGKFDPKGETLSRLFAELGPEADVVVAAKAQLEQLQTRAAELSGGDAGFGQVLSEAFRLARSRSQTSSPSIENQGAILALATVYGSRNLRRFAGLEQEQELVRRVQKSVPAVTLRGRADWTKHFLLSAGLTVVSSTTISDAAGLLKEELDADKRRGGSGFSFGDLLADRAGTRFAWFATRDEQRARSMQARLAEGFVLDDFFPLADGLPEDIDAQEFERTYGGVGGPGYEVVSNSIDRRLRSCTAYR